MFIPLHEQDRKLWLGVIPWQRLNNFPAKDSYYVKLSGILIMGALIAKTEVKNSNMILPQVAST
tara:strand:- start:3743 stop:3934 length:192 start_codon:yes stop_codon:yes gene_type:complete